MENSYDLSKVSHTPSPYPFLNKFPRKGDIYFCDIPLPCYCLWSYPHLKYIYDFAILTKELLVLLLIPYQFTMLQGVLFMPCTFSFPNVKLGASLLVTISVCFIVIHLKKNYCLFSLYLFCLELAFVYSIFSLCVCVRVCDLMVYLAPLSLLLTLCPVCFSSSKSHIHLNVNTRKLFGKIEKKCLKR